MSTTDKTGAKLVDSMRKTKAAASDRPAAAQSGGRGASTEPRPDTGKDAAARRDDPYQSGRRIWPD